MKTLSEVAHKAGARLQGSCGPAALSALTGYTAECCAAWLNDWRGHALDRPTETVSYSEMAGVLRRLGFTVECVWRRRPGLGPRLANWAAGIGEDVQALRRVEERETAHLLNASGHWVTVLGDRLVCSLAPASAAVARSPSAWAEVTGCWSVTGGPEGVEPERWPTTRGRGSGEHGFYCRPTSAPDPGPWGQR